MSGRNHTPNKPLNNNTGTWICNVCTFENVTNKNACEVCNSIKGTKADVGKSNVFNQKDTFQKPQEIHDEPRYKNNDGKCFLCGNGDPIQRKPCKACQYRVFCSACSKRYHDHPHRTWHVDRSNDVTFPRDVENIIGKLNDEFKNLCEDSKKIVESGNSLLEELSKDKQYIIRKLGVAQNLMKERLNYFEELKGKKPELLSIAMTAKRDCLVAERDSQWPYKEGELLTNFKEERKDQMKRIAKKLRGQLQNKMETAGSKVNKPSEKDIDIRKTDDELELKLEGMRMMWDVREDFEWDAHRLKAKAQWDMETNELWTMDAEKYMTENANKDWDTIDNMVKTATTKINKKLEKCNIKFEENRISSSSLNDINDVYQAIEGRVNKLSKITQELDDKMRSAYETIQQQKEKWENLNDNNKEINADLVKKRNECDMLQHKYWEEKGDWTRQSETLKKEAAKSQSLLERTTVEKKSIRIKFEGLEKELQAQKARHEEEQKNWKSQQFIKEQDNLKKVADEWRKRYESEMDKWKDEWQALDSSKCELLKEKEELLKKIENLEHENKKLIKELTSQEIIKNQPGNKVEAMLLNTEEMVENANDSSAETERESNKHDSSTTTLEQNDHKPEELNDVINHIKQENDQLIKFSGQNNIKNQLEKDKDDKGEDDAEPVDAERESRERHSTTTVEKQNDHRPEVKGHEGVNAGIQNIQRQTQQQISEEKPSTSIESQKVKASIDYLNQIKSSAPYPTYRESYLSETYYKPTSTEVTPKDKQAFLLERNNERLPTEPVEFNILVIGDCSSQSPSIPIIINTLASYISSDGSATPDDPPDALIDFEIGKSQGRMHLTFLDRDLNQQQFNLAVPHLYGHTFRFIRMTHSSPWFNAELSDLEMEEMLQIFSQRERMHCIIVAHCPKGMQPLPAKILSLLHKHAANNLIFIEDPSTEKSSNQAQLSPATATEFDPQVFHRYLEFKEDYTHWVIAHRQGNKALSEIIKKTWQASASKWQTELLGKMSTEVLPHDCQQSVVVIKAAILNKSIFGELIDALKDLHVNVNLQQQIRQNKEQIERSYLADPLRQYYNNEISRLTNDRDARNARMNYLLDTGIKLDNYIKENAIISEQSSLKDRIEKAIELKHHQKSSSALKDYLQRVFDRNCNLRFKSIEEISNLWDEIRERK